MYNFSVHLVQVSTTKIQVCMVALCLVMIRCQNYLCNMSTLRVMLHLLIYSSFLYLHTIIKSLAKLLLHSIFLCPTQALNQLFEKIIALDIDERHLLRLGHGEEELQSDKDFSRLAVFLILCQCPCILNALYMYVYVCLILQILDNWSNLEINKYVVIIKLYFQFLGGMMHIIL